MLGFSTELSPLLKRISLFQHNLAILSYNQYVSRHQKRFTNILHAGLQVVLWCAVKCRSEIEMHSLPRNNVNLDSIFIDITYTTMNVNIQEYGVYIYVSLHVR